MEEEEQKALSIAVMETRKEGGRAKSVIHSVDGGAKTEKRSKKRHP